MTNYNDKFKKIYFIALVVLTVIIACWFVFIWLRLDAYEKSTPEKAARQVFDQYFKELAFNKLLAQEVTYVSKLETLNNFTAYLTGRAGSGDRNFINIPEPPESNPEAGIKRYVVFSDSAGIAEFELKEQSGIFGKVWKLSGVRTVFKTIEDLKIVVPAGYNVSINKKPVGINYKTGAGLFSETAGLYDIYTIPGLIAKPVMEARYKGRIMDISFNSEANEYSAIPMLTADIVDGYTLFINGMQVDDSFLAKGNIKTEETGRLRLHRNIYRIPYGLSVQPNVRIVNSAGKESIIQDNGDLTFVQELAYDSDLERQFKEHAILAAKTYSRFMTFNTTIRELRRYFESGTRIYQLIYSSEVYYYTPHRDNWFENENASEFFARDNDTFSCRVTFDNCIRRTANNLFRFPLDVTLFFRKTGGQFMVFDMLLNS